MVTIQQAIEDLNHSELDADEGYDDKICTTSGELIILLNRLQDLEKIIKDAKTGLADLRTKSEMNSADIFVKNTNSKLDVTEILQKQFLDGKVFAYGQSLALLEEK